MSRLVVSLGSLPVLAFRLAAVSQRLGRLRDNDIVLPLPEVADVHAVITRDDRRILIRAAPGEILTRDGRSVTEADLSDRRPVSLGGYRLRWLAADDPATADLHGVVVSGRATDHISTAEAPLPSDHRGPAGPVKAGARLRVAAGPDTGRAIEMDEHAVVIGRAPECDLVLHDETVSWRHCAVERTPDGPRLRDLESRNGTWLDNRRIESALASGDSRIRVGRTVLEFAGPGPDAPGDGGGAGLAEMTGQSPAMQRVYARLREMAASRAPVLLLGPTGTGKELAARAIHTLSPRSMMNG